MFTKILLVLVAIVVILLAVAYLTPREFRLSKSVMIDAPREKVYEYASLLKNQENYSVWVMADPDVELVYTGTDGAIGGTGAWKSAMKNVGVGAQTITALVPNEKITVEIRFEKPMKATNYADTTFETVDGKTQVTNTFYGNNKFPMNITNLFLDKMIGGDIQKNMENLKKIMEEPNQEASTKKTFSPKDLNGVSVQHDNTWTQDEIYMTKTVGTRTYIISFQSNDVEYLEEGGAYARDLKLFKEVSVNGKTHYVFTAANEYGHISSCSITTDQACSPKLPNGGYLFIMFHQYVAGSQYPVELDFNRNDDKQILAEFADIMATLKY